MEQIAQKNGNGKSACRGHKRQDEAVRRPLVINAGEHHGQKDSELQKFPEHPATIAQLQGRQQYAP